MTIERYIVEKQAGQIKTALGGILKLVKEKGIAKVTLVVPTKRNFEDLEFARALGPAAKALAKGQPVGVTDGVPMVLESTSTFRATAGRGLLVGVHISTKDMAKLDDAWGAQAILYLPWNNEEAQEWKATWQPETIGREGEEAQPSSLSEPVEEALKRLTGMINLSTGLSHPLDKQHAQRTFEKLRSEGHSFDPAEVRRWAQRHNWSSGGAADLEKVASKVR